MENLEIQYYTHNYFFMLQIVTAEKRSARRFSLILSNLSSIYFANMQLDLQIFFKQFVVSCKSRSRRDNVYLQPRKQAAVLRFFPEI